MTNKHDISGQKTNHLLCCQHMKDLYTSELFFAFLHACSVAQSCRALCDSVDCSPPGSSVHGILQARIVEWVAMPSSRGSSQPRDRTCISQHLLHWQVGSLPLAPPGKPNKFLIWNIKRKNMIHINTKYLFPFR